MTDLDLDHVTAGELLAAVGDADEAEIISVIKAVSPTVFARMVKRSSDRYLRALMDSDQRTAILDQIMAGMVDAFRTDKAGGQSAIVHWKILDRPGGGYDLYEHVISDGACSSNSEPGHEPDAELRAKPVDFAKIICGFSNPTMAVARGRLKVGGDLNLARKYDSWFQKPKV